MPDRTDVSYLYDGSFDGLLCCVFESYEKKELPLDILPVDSPQSTLYPGREICTEPRRAARVLSAVPRKMGYAALELIKHAFLTCLPQKELHILRFMRLGFKLGPGVMNMLTDDTVNALMKAVKHLRSEAHLLKGFLRFSAVNGGLIAEVEPKNHVLPILAPHFSERYPEESFIIFDRAHGFAYIHRPGEAAILPARELELPEPDDAERCYRELWRLFYRTIEIRERRNPRCRMSHMPKRYWKHMTEFGPSESSNALPRDRRRPLLGMGEGDSR